MLKHLSVAAAMAISTTALMAPTDAAAEPFRHNATGVCQGNLPASETQIRKRPLAIRNEGAASAFISCSLGAEGNVIYDQAQVYLINTSGGSVDIACTVVVGNILTGGTFYPVPVVTVANGQTALVDQDFEIADAVNQINVTCLLPPGVDMGYLRIDSVEP